MVSKINWCPKILCPKFGGVRNWVVSENWLVVENWVSEIGWCTKLGGVRNWVLSENWFVVENWVTENLVVA